MAQRKIIKINQDKCNGCGRCIPNCPEGAIQIIDKKARLISDLFCDGLGACIGYCPEGAITIEEREADRYDERKVMANIVRQGPSTIRAHLGHLSSHNQGAYLKEALDYLKENKIRNPLEGENVASHQHHQGCPGSKVMDLGRKPASLPGVNVSGVVSELGNWPIQLMLVPPFAPYLDNADILISADCLPFAYSRFHQDLLRGKILLVGCPKLDDISLYREKISQILEHNTVKSITYAHMEVPCCSGLVGVIQDAIRFSGKATKFEEAVISIKGERLK